ncbi:hypothetical protein [Bacillus solimangrovi]|uniref:DUF4309 domain-containing protein n=1 Tax=Bacillus solimangrovi TaxID=1305675 RepID=A0A1E5LEQ1_9BACI|nr:hypothetical protein [Bacillus solimangrovi]OEH92555.1 hypothetical protein BFG57_15190 [Bacillus solimangrovi]
MIKITQFTFFLIFSFVILAGCNNNEQVVEEPTTAPEEAPVEQPEQAHEEMTSESSVSIDTFSEGSLDHLGVQIGSAKEEIMEEFGQPIEETMYDGAELLVYDNIAFSLSQVDSTLIAVTLITNKISLFGVHVEQPLNEVKEILGEPTYEGLNDITGEWLLHYSVGENEVYIEAKNNNSDVSLIRFIARNR